MEKELVIMIGNIGAGKSTLVKKYVEEGYMVVCKDSFRYMLGAGQYIYNERSEGGVELGQWYLLGALMVQGFPIVLDETNETIKGRSQFIHLAKAYGYKVTAIQMPILSKEESVRRRLQSNHGDTPKEVWEMVWQRKNDSYESPTFEEGFDLIEFIGQTIK